MKKYIEIGLGNTWFIRTEFEDENGVEFEKRGIHMPQKVISFYIRIWINDTVFILDTKQGYKTSKKTRKSFKILLGLYGYDS